MDGQRIMKIGILGFAHGHVNTYCGQWRAKPALDIEVIAGWDHDAERAAKAGDKHGITCSDSAQAVVDRSDIEAVLIASETSMHAELAVLAARAGKAIVLQKPMSLTLADANAIADAVRKADVPFTVAWQMRADPQNLRIRDLLESHVLGRVFMIRRRHGLATQRMKNFESSWHVNPALNRDIWADDASHPIDFIYWLFGMPQSVTAELASLANPKVPNDNGIALFRYADGMIAEVSCSFVCTAHESTTEIIAEKGTLIHNYGDGPSSNGERPDGGIDLKWYRADQDRWEILDVPRFNGQGERIANLAAPLADFLHGRRPPLATAEEGCDALRMMLACYEANETGTRIPIAGQAPDQPAQS